MSSALYTHFLIICEINNSSSIFNKAKTNNFK